MRLVNKGCDHHMHTLNFSDGLNTIEELVQYAGRIGLREIIITDHSDQNMRDWNRPKTGGRSALQRWRNVHNDVKVGFGVEADLVNSRGDICDTISGIPGSYLVLSAHKESYKDAPETITQGYLNAIERHGGRINMIGHLDAIYFGDYMDVKKVVEAANEKGILIELNAKNLFDGRNVPALTKIMLDTADKVMVSSDAHCLADFDNRQRAFSYLKDNGYIKEENV